MREKRSRPAGRGKRDGHQGQRPDQLNENQVRSLAVVLRSVEEAVDGIRTSVEQKGEEGVLYRVLNPYTPAERREIQEIGARVRQVLGRCQEQWVLPVHTRYLDREVASLASVLWSNLEESRPARLRRYGEVPQALQAPLERDIGELASLVIRLAQIHRQGP